MEIEKKEPQLFEKRIHLLRESELRIDIQSEGHILISVAFSFRNYHFKADFGNSRDFWAGDKPCSRAYKGGKCTQNRNLYLTWLLVNSNPYNILINLTSYF